MLKFDDAKLELDQKSFKQIQMETAWRWASRAAASYDLVLSCHEDQRMRYMIMAAEFFGEAKEHSSEVSPELLQEINDAVDPYMQYAWNFLARV